MATYKVVVDSRTGNARSVTAAEQAAAYHEENAVAAVEPQIRINEPRHRVTIDSESGESSYQVEHRGQGSVSPVDGAGVKVRNNYGPTRLEMAQPDDVVDIPALDGETSVKVAVQLGYLRARTGGGYEVVGQLQQQPASQSPEQQKPQDQPVVDPEADPVADLRGIEPASASTDTTLKALQAHAPMQVEGLIEAVVSGSEPNYAEMARLIGDEGGAAKVQSMAQDFERAGSQALRNVGVENLQGFEEWARSRFPEQARDAVRDLVLSKTVGQLQSLGRQYVRESNTKLVTMLRAQGAEATVKAGVVHVHLKGEWMPLRDAIRKGLVSG